jgi:hypothetical protein
MYTTGADGKQTTKVNILKVGAFASHIETSVLYQWLLHVYT